MLSRIWLPVIIAAIGVFVIGSSCSAAGFCDESIEEALEIAIDDYEQKRDKERDTLLTEIAKLSERLLKKGNIPPKQLASELEQLEKDKELLMQFNNVLPSSRHMTRHVQTSQRKLVPELKACLEAYDLAANSYRKQGDVQRMKLISDAKEAYVRDNEAFDFSGQWACTHSNGWRGTRHINGVFGRSEQGKKLTWTRIGTEVTVVWPDGIGKEVLTFDPQNPDVLTGSKANGIRITWQRRR